MSYKSIIQLRYTSPEQVGKVPARVRVREGSSGPATAVILGWHQSKRRGMELPIDRRFLPLGITLTQGIGLFCKYCRIELRDEDIPPYCADCWSTEVYAKRIIGGEES